MRILKNAFPVLLLSIVCSCAIQKPYMVHQSMTPRDASPPKVIALIPNDIQVFEVTAGGVVEKVREWSDAAEKNICTAVAASRDGDLNLQQLDPARLTPVERDTLNQHLALFDIVAGNALWATNPQMGPPWNLKREHFDYTIGNGLSFLRTNYGYDAGLIVTGFDYISTPGRKGMMVAAMFLGVAIPMGHTFIVAGLVDFETGDILWFDHASDPSSTDLREADSTRKFVVNIMADFKAFYAGEYRDAD